MDYPEAKAFIDIAQQQYWGNDLKLAHYLDGQFKQINTRLDRLVMRHEARLAAAKKIDELICFSDRVYDVREREGKGWDGPDVKAYIQACKEFKNELPDPL